MNEATAPAILMYGRDPVVLETRGMVLQKAGFQVHCVQELAEAERITAVEPINLLLLCHTLSIEECGRVLEAASQLRPGMQRLLITANQSVCVDVHADPAISIYDGPRALVEMATKMLVASKSFAS